MGKSTSELWVYLGRFPRDEFFVLQICIWFFGYIAYCILGVVAWGNWSAAPILIIPYFVSALFLAKRFQDCGVCGKWILFLSVLTIICVTFESDILSTLGFFLLCLYVIILIVMCFVKGDKGKNKYGDGPK